MLAVLDDFVFDLHADAPFDSAQRQTAQRIAANQRLGFAPAHQYVGPGDETITLSGSLMPELSHGPLSIQRLRDMAEAGKSYVLIDGRGNYQGEWIIESVNEDRSEFIGDGQARRINFSLALRRDIDWWDAGL